MAPQFVVVLLPTGILILTELGYVYSGTPPSGKTCSSMVADFWSG